MYFDYDTNNTKRNNNLKKTLRQHTEPKITAVTSTKIKIY